MSYLSKQTEIPPIQIKRNDFLKIKKENDGNVDDEEDTQTHANQLPDHSPKKLMTSVVATKHKTWTRSVLNKIHHSKKGQKRMSYLMAVRLG